MRYQLMVKDGRVLEGEIVGEMAGSLLFRESGRSDGIKVIHISELKAAWRLEGRSEPRRPGRPLVTYDKEFRVIDYEEVESLTSEGEDLPTTYPLPEFYHETSVHGDTFVLTMETGELTERDIDVVLTEGIVNIFLSTRSGPRQVAGRLPFPGPYQSSMKVGEHMTEVVISPNG